MINQVICSDSLRYTRDLQISNSILTDGNGKARTEKENYNVMISCKTDECWSQNQKHFFKEK
jgi:hypothetical protein